MEDCYEIRARACHIRAVSEGARGMSESEEKRLENIDIKVGRAWNQFNDITHELSRLLLYEMDTQDLIQTMAELLEECKGVIFANDPRLNNLETRIEVVLKTAEDSLEDKG